MGAFNQWAFEVIYGWSHRYPLLDIVGVFFAEYLAYFLVAAFFVLLYYEKEWPRRFYLFAEGAIAVMLSRGLVTEIIRFFSHHLRPFDAIGIKPLIPESGWSFPSGHMTFYFALAMVVWYTNRKWGQWFLVLTAIMGIARIYVGVHWPLDILGGAAIGVLSAVVVRYLLKTPRSKLL